MAQVETVTSAANPLLKEVRRAGARGTLTSGGLWITEGFNLLQEALRSELEIPVVLTSESALAMVEPHAPRRLVVVPDRLFNELATTQSPQGVIALVRPPIWNLDQLFHRTSAVLVLDGIQDPGNAGAIMRAAEAFGASGVIFVRGTVSPHNAKTLRASAGSLFRVPFAVGIETEGALDALRRQGRNVYAAMPRRAEHRLAEELDLERNCALIIGSEGGGVSAEFQAHSEPIAIATMHVESLNAAMAAAILLYEAQRQRVAKAMLA